MVDEDTDIEDTAGQDTINEKEGMAPGEQEGNPSMATPSGAGAGMDVVTAVHVPTKTPETPEETKARK